MTNLTRRDFLRGAAAASIAAGLGSKLGALAHKGGRGLLFVGTQTSGTSKGIYAYRWDAAQGELTQLGLAAETDSPTFLTIDPAQRFLYAANEIDEFQGQKSGAVSSYTIDASDWKLKTLNEVSAMGPGTCHVATDHQGKGVFCANYSGGSAASFYVYPDGQLSNAVSHFQYTGKGPKRQQDAAHAHRVTPSPDDRYLLINDLGLDCIHVYRLDASTAKLTANDPPQWSAAPGSGPRALRFHPSGKWAYCLHELTSEVEVLRWNGQKGVLTSIQKVKLNADDYNGPETAGSEVVVTRKGDFVYAANRFADTLVSFSVDKKTGKLTVLGRTPSGGKVPRHIALDPTEKWLLSAHQESDGIAVIARDPATGKLAETAKTFPISRPQCLVFL